MLLFGYPQSHHVSCSLIENRPVLLVHLIPDSYRIFALTLSKSCSLVSPFWGCRFRCMYCQQLCHNLSLIRKLCSVQTYRSEPSSHFLRGPSLWITCRVCAITRAGGEYVAAPDRPCGSCCHDTSKTCMIYRVSTTTYISALLGD